MLNKSENQEPPDYIYTGDLIMILTVDLDGECNYFVKSIEPNRIGDMLVEMAGDFRNGGDMWLDFHRLELDEESKIIRDEYSHTMRSIDHEAYPFVLLFDGDKIEIRAHQFKPGGIITLLEDAAAQMKESSELHDQLHKMEEGL